MVSDKHVDYFGDLCVADVAEMHERFGFTWNHEPTRLSQDVLTQRADFLKEELTELYEGIGEADYPKIIDALVDLAVVTMGTAVMLGIKWDLHWMEVHRANMAKERGHNPNRPDQEEDLIKPEGWVAPDHKKVLAFYAKEKI